MRDEKGMTIVEVMVAFVILLLGVAFLYRSTLFSLEQTKLAQKVQKQADDTYNVFYGNTKTADVSGAATITTDNGEGGTLSWTMPIQIGHSVSSAENGEIHIYFFQPKGGI